jgi:hypothetical protein
MMVVRYGAVELANEPVAVELPAEDSKDHPAVQEAQKSPEAPGIADELFKVWTANQEWHRERQARAEEETNRAEAMAEAEAAGETVPELPPLPEVSPEPFWSFDCIQGVQSEIVIKALWLLKVKIEDKSDTPPSILEWRNLLKRPALGLPVIYRRLVDYVCVVKFGLIPLMSKLEGIQVVRVFFVNGDREPGQYATMPVERPVVQPEHCRLAVLEKVFGVLSHRMYSPSRCDKDDIEFTMNKESTVWHKDVKRVPGVRGDDAALAHANKKSRKKKSRKEFAEQRRKDGADPALWMRPTNAMDLENGFHYETMMSMAEALLIAAKLRENTRQVNIFKYRFGTTPAKLWKDPESVPYIADTMKQFVEEKHTALLKIRQPKEFDFPVAVFRYPDPIDEMAEDELEEATANGLKPVGGTDTAYVYPVETTLDQGAAGTLHEHLNPKNSLGSSLDCAPLLRGGYHLIDGKMLVGSKEDQAGNVVKIKTNHGEPWEGSYEEYYERAAHIVLSQVLVATEMDRNGRYRLPAKTLQRKTGPFRINIGRDQLPAEMKIWQSQPAKPATQKTSSTPAAETSPGG